MDWEELANRLVKAINARRVRIGLTPEEAGKLALFTNSLDFDDWLNASPDNSARIALGAKCAMFQHKVVTLIPDELESDQKLSLDGAEFGFMVEKLDDKAWRRKSF